MAVGIGVTMAVLLNYVLAASLVGTVSASLLLALFCMVQNQSEHLKFNMLFYSVLLPYFGCVFSPFIQLDVFRKDASAEIISSIKSKFEAVDVTDLAVPLCGKASPNIFKILFCIWLFVTLILIFKTALSHFSYLKAIDRSAAFMFKIGRVNVYSVNAGISPIITHVFNTAVYLPKERYSENELRMVIAHEMTHFSHNDVIKRMLISVLSCINWFNPLFQIILKRLLLQMEYSCDEAVTKNMSFEQRKQYGYMLLQTKGLFTKQSPFGVGLGSSADDLKRRIGIFMNKNRAAKRSAKIVSVVCFSVVSALALCISAFALTQKNVGNSTIKGNVVGTMIPQEPINGFSELSEVGEKISSSAVKASVEAIPTDRMYSVAALNNRVSDLAYVNGEVIVITDEGGEKYFFEENRSAVINVEADFSAEYSYDAVTGERLSVGYIFDGTAYELFSGRVKGDGLAVEFTANQTGEYLFYICNLSAGMQNYSNVQISVL